MRCGRSELGSHDYRTTGLQDFRTPGLQDLDAPAVISHFLAVTLPYFPFSFRRIFIYVLSIFFLMLFF